MHLYSKDLIEKGKILLFDNWHPQSECRLDFYNRPDDVGEVWILKVPMGYSCKVKWYYRNPGLIRSILGMRKYKKEEMEQFFSGFGGGGLKALIRGTNVYFGRDDDVDDGIHKSGWGDL